MTAAAHHSDCDRLGERNYANGDCQALAAAIQYVTGWKVALFEGAGNHVTAMTPDGAHVDIHGVRDAAGIARVWQSDVPQVFRSIDDLGWAGTGWCVCDLRAAHEVLNRAGLLTDMIRQTIEWEVGRLV